MQSTSTLSGVEVSLVRKSGKTVARCTTSGGNSRGTPNTRPDRIAPAAPLAATHPTIKTIIAQRIGNIIPTAAG